MGILSKTLEFIMSVAMKGEFDKVAQTTSEGGEFYELSMKAKESTKNLSDKVNADLQDMIGAKDEEEIYSKLENNELSDTQIDALRFAVEVYEKGRSSSLSPSAKSWLEGASKALNRYDVYKQEYK